MEEMCKAVIQELDKGRVSEDATMRYLSEMKKVEEGKLVAKQ